MHIFKRVGEWLPQTVFFGGIALGLVAFFWVNQPFVHLATVVAFRIEAVSTFEEWDSYQDCTTNDGQTTCATRHRWEARYRLTNALDDRSNPALSCIYDREPLTNQRWQCTVTRLIAVELDTGKRAWCAYNNDRWLYAEMGSELQVAENRLGIVSC